MRLGRLGHRTGRCLRERGASMHMHIKHMGNRQFLPVSHGVRCRAFLGSCANHATEQWERAGDPVMTLQTPKVVHCSRGAGLAG